MEFINYNGELIRYVISNKGTKNLYARMDDNGIVKISIPYFITKKSIEKFVVDSYFKLIKRKNKRNKNVVNNGKINILGNEYNVDEVEDLNYLLSSKLKEYLKDNYINICDKLNVTNPPSVVLKKVKGYLGQYNKKSNRITLNILIGHLDKDCVEYVIVHELTHIRYMNHQKEFWCEVEKYLPNYKKLRNRCKKEFVYYENY